MSIEATNTGSTVDVTYGSMCGRMGYHFDFGDHVEYISFLDQRKAEAGLSYHITFLKRRF